MSKFNRDGPLDSRDDRYYDCIVRNPFYPANISVGRGD